VTFAGQSGSSGYSWSAWSSATMMRTALGRWVFGRRCRADRPRRLLLSWWWWMSRIVASLRSTSARDVIIFADVGPRRGLHRRRNAVLVMPAIVRGRQACRGRLPMRRGVSGAEASHIPSILPSLTASAPHLSCVDGRLFSGADPIRPMPPAPRRRSDDLGPMFCLSSTWHRSALHAPVRAAREA